MGKTGKKHQQDKAKIDPARQYGVEEAVALLGQLNRAKFDETVEVTMHLGIDPKKAEQQLRGTLSLPKGIGKTQRVIAIAEGEAAEAARAAGADEVGGAELIQRIQDGWLEFDVALTTPDMMRQVGKLGRTLGPKGLMPSPKSGTVTPDLATAVTEFKAGKIEFRTDALGNVNAPVGKRSFAEEDLVMNVDAFIQHVRDSRPATVKGRFILKASLSSSMSPGIRLAVA